MLSNPTTSPYWPALSDAMTQYAVNPDRSQDDFDKVWELWVKATGAEAELNRLASQGADTASLIKWLNHTLCDVILSGGLQLAIDPTAPLETQAAGAVAALSAKETALAALGAR